MSSITAVAAGGGLDDLWLSQLPVIWARDADMKKIVMCCLLPTASRMGWCMVHTLTYRVECTSADLGKGQAYCDITIAHLVSV